MTNSSINPEFLNRMNEITAHVKSAIENYTNKSHYWSAPTYAMEMIAEYGAENIFMVGHNYHGRYEDDYADFTYYNNVTGEFFTDNWTTAAACPAYSSYECTSLKEAWDNNAINKEVFLNKIKEGQIKIFESFTFNYNYNFEKFADLNLLVHVDSGRKWKGTGYLIGYYTKSFRFAYPMYRNRYYGVDPNFGVNTTGYCKIYDPMTNRIETVIASHVKVTEGEKFINEYINSCIEKIKNATVDDLYVGTGSCTWNPSSGDHSRVPFGINCGIISFKDFLLTKKNFINIENAYDEVEEEKKKKFSEFKTKKMTDLIEWVKNNTDKEGDDILKLAESIFNKKYINN